jgi:hypothetical protein
MENKEIASEKWEIVKWLLNKIAFPESETIKIQIK